MTQKTVCFSDASLADSLEIVLEPRVMFDGAAVATAAQAADQVNHQADNAAGENQEATPQADGDSASISGTGADKTLTVDTDGNVQGNVNGLFSDVKVNGDSFDHVTIEADASREGHVLHIGGADVQLKTGTTVEMSDEFSGLTCSVTITETGKYKVTVDLLSLSAEQVNSLIQGISYSANGKTLTDGQSIAIKIIGISNDKDSDGLLDKSINAEITVQSSYNQEPSVSIGGEGFNIVDQINFDSKSAEFSADGSKAWIFGENGTIKVFEVKDGKLTEIAELGDDSLSGASQITVSKDGNFAYLLLSDNKIQEIKLGADKLSLGKSFVATSKESITSIKISENGEFLYSTGEYGQVAVWNVSKDFPDLVGQQSVSTTMSGFLETVGDRVFVAVGGMFSSGTLYVYHQNDNGELLLLQSEPIPIIGIYRDNVIKTAVSSNGKNFSLYAEGWDGGQIISYSISDDGSVVTKGSVKNITDVVSLTYSSAGSILNVLTSEEGKGKVIAYTVSEGAILDDGKVVAENIPVDSGMDLSSKNELMIWGDSVVLLGSELVGTLGQELGIGSLIHFSDPEMDLQDNFDQSQISIEITGASGEFHFQTSGYSIHDGKIYAGGTKIGTYITTDTKLTIVFSEGCTKTQALTVVQGWSFAASSSKDGKAIISVEFTDKQGKSSSAQLDASLGVNEPPSASMNGAETKKEITTAGQDFTVFGNISLNAGEAGQRFKGFTVTVDGISDAHEKESITVDGTTIYLTQSGKGQTSSGLSWSYVVSGDKGTLQLTASTAISLENAQSVLNQITYRNESVAGETGKGLTGTRHFALTSLQDNGGTASGGVDIAIISGVEVSIGLKMNSSPVIDMSGTDHSSDLYIPDNFGDLISDQIVTISSSSDGKYIFVVGNDASGGAGNSTLYVLTKDSHTGSVTVIQSIPEANVDGLHGLSSLLVTGSTVYAAGTTATGNACIVQFAITADGQLESKGIVAEQGVEGVVGLTSSISKMTLSADGKYLYAVNGRTVTQDSVDGSSLIIFSLGDNGDLNFINSYSTDQGLNAPNAMVISPDGKYVYVANGNRSISVFIQENGELTQLQVINKETIGSSLTNDAVLSKITGISLSADGKYLYVVGGPGSGGIGISNITVFSVQDDGKANFLKTVDLANPGNSVGYSQFSADGKYVYISGTLGSTCYITKAELLDGNVSVVAQNDNVGWIPNFHVTSTGDIFGGNIRNQGLLGAELTPVVEIVDGKANIGNGVLISDQDADIDDDYKGFTITISRDGQENVGDSFSIDDTSGFKIVNDKLVQNGKEIGTFINADGKLAITFTQRVDKSTVNSLLASVVYTLPSSESQVTLKVQVSDGEKDTNATIVVVQKDVAIHPDLNTQDYVAGSAIFEKVSVNFSPKVGEVAHSSSVIITSTDSQAQFGLTGDYQLVDGVIMKGSEKIASWMDSGKGTVTLVFEDSAKSADINSVLNSITYSSKDAAPKGTVTFSMEFASKDGKYTDDCKVVASIDFGTNHAPVVNQSVADSLDLQIEPGKEGTLSIPSGLITDQDETDKGKLTWLADGLPNGWSFESVNGQLVIHYPADADFSGVSITVKASDSSNASASVTVWIGAQGVENTPPVWADAAANAFPDHASAGTSVNVDLSKLVTDKETPNDLTFSVEGELPPGLSLADDGKSITGKLTKAMDSPYRLQIKVTDKGGKTASFTWHISVSNAIPEFVGREDSWTVTANKGQTFEYDASKYFTDANVVEGTQTLNWKVQFNPELSEDKFEFTDGKLILKGVAPGTYTFTITANDGYQGTVSHDFTVTVENQAPVFVGNENLGSITTDDRDVAIDIKSQFYDVDKDQGLTFSISDADQEKLAESGLTFDSSTGTVKAIAGKPTKPAELTFTVTVTDGFSDPVSNQFRLTVRDNQQPVINPNWAPGANASANGSTVNLTINSPFEADISNAFMDLDADDQGNVVIALKDPDSLPSWLHYDERTKTLSGTPESLGSVEMTVLVSDGHGDPVEHTLVFSIENPPFTVPVTQFQHAPLYDPVAGHELEEDLFLPTAPESSLPDANLDLTGSSDTFANSQGLTMAVTSLQASESASCGLSAAALLSGAEVAKVSQIEEVEKSLQGMDQTGKATAIRVNFSMTLPTQGDAKTGAMDQFLWQQSSVILDGQATLDGESVLVHPEQPISAMQRQISALSKPSLSDQVRESSAYGDDRQTDKA